MATVPRWHDSSRCVILCLMGTMPAERTMMTEMTTAATKWWRRQQNDRDGSSGNKTMAVTMTKWWWQRQNNGGGIEMLVAATKWQRWWWRRRNNRDDDVATKQWRRWQQRWRCNGDDKMMMRWRWWQKNLDLNKVGSKCCPADGCPWVGTGLRNQNATINRQWVTEAKTAAYGYITAKKVLKLTMNWWWEWLQSTGSDKNSNNNWRQQKWLQSTSGDKNGQQQPAHHCWQ